MASRGQNQAPLVAVRGPKVEDVNCAFFLRGKCKFGAQCKFLHPTDLDAPQDSSSSLHHTRSPDHRSKALDQADKDIFDLEMIERSLPRISTPCKFFLAGNCARGDQCRYTHITAILESAEDCPICMQPIQPPKQYGLLSDCDHAVCLDCIREWRRSDEQNESKYCCPLCRTKSNLVIPSSVFAKGSGKNEIRATYVSRLSKMPCKHFSFGKGRCPFAPNCFYAHVNENGELLFDEQGLQSSGQKRNRFPSRMRRDLRTARPQNHYIPLSALEIPDSIARVLRNAPEEQTQALLRLYLSLGLATDGDLELGSEDEVQDPELHALISGILDAQGRSFPEHSYSVSDSDSDSDSDAN